MYVQNFKFFFRLDGEIMWWGTFFVRLPVDFGIDQMKLHRKSEISMRNSKISQKCQNYKYSGHIPIFSEKWQVSKKIFISKNKISKRIFKFPDKKIEPKLL